MHMNMAGHSGAGRFAQVHSQIEALRPVHLAQMYFRQPGHPHHLVENGFGSGFQAGNVLVGGNHQMPRRVRINIQDDKGPGTAMDYVILFIALLGTFDAEQAPCRGAGLADVLVTPWTPEMVHQDDCAGSVAVVATPGTGAGLEELFTMSFNS